MLPTQCKDTLLQKMPMEVEPEQGPLMTRSFVHELVNVQYNHKGINVLYIVHGLGFQSVFLRELFLNGHWTKTIPVSKNRFNFPLLSKTNDCGLDLQQSHQRNWCNLPCSFSWPPNHVFFYPLKFILIYIVNYNGVIRDTLSFSR